MIVAGDDMVTGASGAKSKIVCLVDYSEGSDMIVGGPGVDSIKDLKGKKSASNSRWLNTSFCSRRSKSMA